jgi:hypothetical protein
MKMFLSCLFILTLSDCYAGTGFASDGILFVLSVLSILILLLATGYLIDFLKVRIKEARLRKCLNEDMKDGDEEQNHSCDEAIPGIYNLSGF